ncbi:hypothetical protein ElyMa_002547000 [Elysia marginata]|uniref:Uncharacterized protein n=1 Tax=Elysia marginata TaxID=1093978 RepID=A0AAV4GWK3_9GAST|nr:hypothetical protein ElyMa_002547000 [Elysia marginata]
MPNFSHLSLGTTFHYLQPTPDLYTNKHLIEGSPFGSLVLTLSSNTDLDRVVTYYAYECIYRIAHYGTVPIGCHANSLFQESEPQRVTKLFCSILDWLIGVRSYCNTHGEGNR